METSTPVNSPKQKKHSLVQKFLPVDETLGDIETEKQSRRLEAIIRSTESRRRLSTAPLLAGYTASQLAQHCKDVIKLSTENKINCKNAFNFWIIDVMAAMAKKNDSEINKNFQVASCTLDASVKIYGYRVDAIHTDAVKMAGGFFKKEVQSADEEGEKQTEGEENQPKPKTKKKKRKLTVVAPDTLNSKSESEVMLDVVPRQTFLTRKPDGNELLVKIPKYNDGGLMQLDSDYPCWPFDPNALLVPKFENKEMFDPEDLKALLSGIEVSKSEHLCPTYSNFEFGKENSDSEDELQTSQNTERFEFDMNASYHEEEFDDLPETQKNRIQIPAGGFQSDEEIVFQPEKQKRQESAAISEMKARITINPLEYSMFDEKMLKAWAGPAHWKLRPVRKPLEEYTNHEDSSKPVASKRTRKGKVKTPTKLFDIYEDVVMKNMAENEKTTLFKSTMLNWSLENTTMPEDLKCKAKNLFTLYHIPSFAILRRSDSLGADVDQSDEDNDNEKEEELEYCSTSAVHEDRPEDDEPNRGERLEDEAWDLGNMVEAPNKVEKIQVSAFKRKKHVDIKHLKKGLWSVLTGEDKEDAVVGKELEFRELVKLFPGKVSKSFSALLTAPLIFNALLHLTNEKCLVLTQDKVNKYNFVISQ